MTSEGLTPDEDLLGKIPSIDEKIISICDLIPISTWGLSADDHEELRKRKHRIVNQHLTPKEKRTLTNSEKQQVASAVGGICRRVSEVFDLLSDNPEEVSGPKKAVSSNQGSRKMERKAELEEKEEETTKSSVKNNFRLHFDVEMDDDESRASLPKTFEKSHKHGPSFTANNGAGSGACSSSDAIVGRNEDVSKMKRKKHYEDDSSEVQPKRKKFDANEREYEKKDVSLNIFKQREVAMGKLQEKLRALKASRQGKSGVIKDSSSVAKLEEKRKLKRRISKMKMKQRRAKERQLDADGEKNTKEVLETKPSKDETVSFSKFDFVVKENLKKKRLTTSEKKQKFTGKDYKSLIKKVEQREEKLEKLREREPEKSFEVEDTIRWNRVLNKAQGSKVKDNMQLLQKGLKRKEKLKKKKKENWSNRKAALIREKEKKQEKRKENIQKRIDDKKRRKVKILKKKGRLL